jgi:hypothetical protein
MVSESNQYVGIQVFPDILESTLLILMLNAQAATRDSEPLAANGCREVMFSQP